MGIERRLNNIEKNLNTDRDKIELENGESIYLSKQDLLEVYNNAIIYAAGGGDWSDLSELTRKIGEKAKDDQEPVQRARIMLGKEEDPEKTEAIP